MLTAFGEALAAERRKARDRLYQANAVDLVVPAQRGGHPLAIGRNEVPPLPWGLDVPPISWSRDAGLQATGWMDGCIISYSIGVRIPRAE